MTDFMDYGVNCIELGVLGISLFLNFKKTKMSLKFVQAEATPALHFDQKHQPNEKYLESFELSVNQLIEMKYILQPNLQGPEM